MKRNVDIRDEAKRSGVHLWEVAEAMNVSDTYFSKLLRHEMTAAQKAKAMASIKLLAMVKRSAGEVEE